MYHPKLKAKDGIPSSPPVGKRKVWLARYAGSPADPPNWRIEFFVFAPQSGTPEAGFPHF